MADKCFKSIGERCRYMAQVAKTEVMKYTLTAAADEIERLRDYIEFDANCPCCQQTYECEEECTFAEDNPSDVERMNTAREVLKPTGIPPPTRTGKSHDRD